MKIPRRKAKEIAYEWVEENEGDGHNFSIIACKYKEEENGYVVKIIYRMIIVAYRLFIGDDEVVVVVEDCSHKIENYEVWDNTFLEIEPEYLVEKKRVKDSLLSIKRTKRIQIKSITEHDSQEDGDDAEFLVCVNVGYSFEEVQVKVICEREISNARRRFLKKKYSKRIVFIHSVPSMYDVEIKQQLVSMIREKAKYLLKVQPEGIKKVE